MADVRRLFYLSVLILWQLSSFVRPSRVTAKPEIISSAQDIEVGASHLLLCKAGAEGRMTWYKDGDEIDDEQLEIEVVDETSSKLIIKKARIEDSGIYKCRVDFDSDGATATYQLFVYTRPKFFSKTHYEFLEGDDAVLPCRASGLPEVEVKWRKVTDGRGLDIGTAAASAGMCEQMTVLPDNSLKIAKIRRNQRGTYRCVASIRNRPISEELAISVVVNAPPTAEMHQKGTTVQTGPGTNVTISCLVTGVPTPNISWISPPRSDSSRYKYNSDRSELTIPGVVRRDFGDYMCVATNKIGESWASFELNVTVHPKVSLSRTIMEVEPGRNASVTCAGTGHPPPQIFWVRKGTNMELTSSSIRLRTVGHTLEFEGVEPSDGGLYTCVALNDIGNDTRDFSLETWPGAPSQISVLPGPASALVSMDTAPVDGGTPLTHYILEWRKDDETLWNQTAIPATEALVLPSLKPYTSYHVRMAAKNRLGQGKFSSEHTVRTLSNREPDSPVLMDSEVLVEKNSFSIPIKQLDHGNTPILHYIVRYRTDSEDEDWTEAELPANATGIRLAGLQYNTSYQLEVTAVNPQGSSSPAYFSFGVPQAPVETKTTIGKAGVTAIVILIFLVLLIAVDATCCYVNRCGLLMYLAVKLLGERAPGVKSAEEGCGDLNNVDMKLNGLRAQRGSVPKQPPPQNGAENGAQPEVTCDKAPLTKFEKAPPATDPATEA